MKKYIKKVFPNAFNEALYCLKETIVKNHYIDSSLNYKSSVLLAGWGRSGTTWLGNIINFDNGYRYMFEPFHPKNIDLWGNGDEIQYFRADEKSKEFIASVKRVLEGRIRGRKLDIYNRRIFSDRRLIKCIFGNLLLKPLHVNFPEIPIVFVLRHPCAVVSSQLGRKAWYWGGVLKDYLNHQTLCEDYLHPFKEIAKTIKGDFEELVFAWCVQNYVPLKQFKRDEIHIIFYEDFCKQPKEETEKLFKYLNKTYDHRIHEVINRPSQTAWNEDSAIKTHGNLVDGWRKRVTSEQINRTIEILREFGLDKIYTQESMPQREGLDHFLS